MDIDVAILLKLEELDIKFRALKEAVIDDNDTNYRMQLFEQAMAQLKGILATANEDESEADADDTEPLTFPAAPLQLKVTRVVCNNTFLSDKPLQPARHLKGIDAGLKEDYESRCLAIIE